MGCKQREINSLSRSLLSCRTETHCSSCSSDNRAVACKGQLGRKEGTTQGRREGSKKKWKKGRKEGSRDFMPTQPQRLRMDKSGTGECKEAPMPGRGWNQQASDAEQAQMLMLRDLKGNSKEKEAATRQKLQPPIWPCFRVIRTRDELCQMLQECLDVRITGSREILFYLFSTIICARRITCSKVGTRGLLALLSALLGVMHVNEGVFLCSPAGRSVLTEHRDISGRISMCTTFRIHRVQMRLMVTMRSRLKRAVVPGEVLMQLLKC